MIALTHVKFIGQCILQACVTGLIRQIIAPNTPPCPEPLQLGPSSVPNVIVAAWIAS